jgi:hypothetical protein
MHKKRQASEKEQRAARKQASLKASRSNVLGGNALQPPPPPKDDDGWESVVRKGRGGGGGGGVDCSGGCHHPHPPVKKKPADVAGGFTYGRGGRVGGAAAGSGSSGDGATPGDAEAAALASDVARAVAQVLALLPALSRSAFFRQLVAGVARHPGIGGAGGIGMSAAADNDADAVAAAVTALGTPPGTTTAAAVAAAAASAPPGPGGGAAGGVTLVCWGLGSFASSSNARYQLACALLLRHRLSGGSAAGMARAELFDPVMGEVDAAVCAAVGVAVLERNEQGKRACTAAAGGPPVVFFMPHCPMRLYSNLLWANWGRALANLVVVGNSLPSYGERVLTPEQRADPTNCVLRLLPLLAGGGSGSGSGSGSGRQQSTATPRGAAKREEKAAPGETARESEQAVLPCANEPGLPLLERAFNDTSAHVFVRVATAIERDGVLRPDEFLRDVEDHI